jgi:hypothetical protein
VTARIHAGHRFAISNRRNQAPAITCPRLATAPIAFVIPWRLLAMGSPLSIENRILPTLGLWGPGWSSELSSDSAARSRSKSAPASCTSPRRRGCGPQTRPVPLLGSTPTSDAFRCSHGLHRMGVHRCPHRRQGRRDLDAVTSPPVAARESKQEPGLLARCSPTTVARR